MEKHRLRTTEMVSSILIDSTYYGKGREFDSPQVHLILQRLQMKTRNKYDLKEVAFLSILALIFPGLIVYALLCLIMKNSDQRMADNEGATLIFFLVVGAFSLAAWIAEITLLYRWLF